MRVEKEYMIWLREKRAKASIRESGRVRDRGRRRISHERVRVESLYLMREHNGSERLESERIRLGFLGKSKTAQFWTFYCGFFFFFNKQNLVPTKIHILAVIV